MKKNIEEYNQIEENNHSSQDNQDKGGKKKALR